VWLSLTYWIGYAPMFWVVNLGVAIGAFYVADWLAEHAGPWSLRERRASSIQACLKPIQERVASLIEEQVSDPRQVLANLREIPSRPGVASGLDSISNVVLHPLTPKVSQGTRATTLTFAGNYGAAPVAAAHVTCRLWKGMHTFCRIGKSGTLRREEHATLRVVAPLTGNGEAIVDLRFTGVQGQITCIVQGYALLWAFVDWKNCIKPIGSVFLAGCVTQLLAISAAAHFQNSNLAYLGGLLALFALLLAVMKWAKGEREPTAHERAEVDALVSAVVQNVNAVATTHVEMEWSPEQRRRPRGHRRLFATMNLGRPAIVVAVLLASVVTLLVRMSSPSHQEQPVATGSAAGKTEQRSTVATEPRSAQ
jgi:hypothetical protein